MMADSDIDGVGAFLQAPGTLIKTATFGNIVIQASGQSAIANISSAGNLNIKTAKNNVVFTQQNNSIVIAAMSFLINQQTTLKAANAIYIIGQNWQNNGTFVPQTSQVILTGPLQAKVIGSNNFYDLIIDPNLNVSDFQNGNYHIDLFNQNGQYSPPKKMKTLTMFQKM